MTSNRMPIGEIRPSQLLWTYGPGALIDLPNLSVVTLGSDTWEEVRCQPIEEPRLLDAVRKILGPQIGALRMPPFLMQERIDPYSAEALVGVPVKPFPRWLRCVECGLLSPLDDDLFHPKEDRYRPERTKFVHKGCTGSRGNKKARDADAVPARFLLACRAGHLDDFPWHYFVHNGPSDCKGNLRFYESGASLQTENLWVKCDGCLASRSMAQAFGQVGQQNLPKCRGRHPHLETFDGTCSEKPRAVLLGATNSWFPITLSALHIPAPTGSALDVVEHFWDDLEGVTEKAVLGVVLPMLKRREAHPGLSKFSLDQIWDAIVAKRDGAGHDNVDMADIKGPEWEVLIETKPRKDWPDFMAEPTAVPERYKGLIASVSLIERLREVNALLGFTRVEAPEHSEKPEDAPVHAALTKRSPAWVPATQVHGEGIFIRFDEEVVAAWEDLPSVRARNDSLTAGHRGWRNARKLDPDAAYPGARYVMLHSLSHLLIRELALECGYNSASIRERIYAETASGAPQAGILIYTSAADSDGTLGGLVDLGRPENLGRLLDQALARGSICSSDPLCSEHDPKEDRSLHAAACHACSFVSETSCENGNRYIDRAFLVPTLDATSAAFFWRTDA
ncbi:DrmB family protein [Rhodovulum sp. YNF3179]|uniref:DrmB family protein n=1 Tax=Rhodovulum sp. YNF3179 TaxID=3425127 RepID=UPI003D338B51